MKTGKKGFFSKLFASGNNDNISNKRVIAFLAFIILSVLGCCQRSGITHKQSSSMFSVHLLEHNPC